MREILIQVWDGEEMSSGMPLPMLAGWLYAKYPNIGSDWVYRECVGFPDRNGRMIYEGDILRQWYNGHEIIAPMMWNQNKAQYGMDATISFAAPAHIEVGVRDVATQAPEIIGDIFRNPELLPKE